jgi:hypothetical protein
MRRLFPGLSLCSACHATLQATTIWSRCDQSARWGTSFVIGIPPSFRFLVHPVERESRKYQNQQTEANARCAHKSSPSLSNLIIERLGTFRCPTVGLLSAVFRSALGLQAQPLPPNGVSLVIRLTFHFPQWLCFACSSVLLSALRHSAGDFAPNLIIVAGSDSPLDDNPSPTVGTSWDI